MPEAAARQSETGEYRAVVERLVRLERELNDLQRATYSRLAAARTTGGRTATDGGYAPPSGSDLQRLSDLEATLRSLTGRLEELEFQVRQLDARMQRLSAGSGPAGLTPPQSAPAGAPPGEFASDMPPGPGQPRNLAAEKPLRGQANPDSGAGAPSIEPRAPAAQPASPAPQPARPAGNADARSSFPALSGDEGRDFNTARDLLLKGEFARAGDMFGAIAKAYPKSKLAGDSQFWKAESLFVRELYRDAAEAYLAVARDFPDSAKAPDSLVKLSLSFDKLGERKQACAALSQLDRRYPSAPEKVRQNAERIKQEFACA